MLEVCKRNTDDELKSFLEKLPTSGELQKLCIIWDVTNVKNISSTSM